MKVRIVVVAFFTYIQGIFTDGNIPDSSHVQFVEMGQNTNITCELGKNSGNLQWYKENEDGGLQAMSRSACDPKDKDSKYHVYCENRSILAMEIRNIRPSDSGVYYCSISGLDQNFHLASTLIVTERYPRKPTLSILASEEEHSRATESIVLLCVAHNWTKKWDRIKWTLNGTEQESWTTLDPYSGSLRSLYAMSRSIQYPVMSCFIQETTTGEKISLNFMASSSKITDDERSISDCYIVLYVGLPIIITLLLVHLSILAIRRRTLSKETPRSSDTHQERHVRFSPEDESVTYAAVKS